MFEDVSHYFLEQLLSDEAKYLTQEHIDRLSDSGKKKFVVGDIAVAYFKLEPDGTRFDGVPGLTMRMEFTSLKKAINEVNGRKFVEARRGIPTFEF